MFHLALSLKYLLTADTSYYVTFGGWFSVIRLTPPQGLVTVAAYRNHFDAAPSV
jgi:hypothetical protein